MTKDFNNRVPIGTPIKYWPAGTDDFVFGWTTSKAFNRNGQSMIWISCAPRPVHLKYLIVESKEAHAAHD